MRLSSILSVVLVSWLGAVPTFAQSPCDGYPNDSSPDGVDKTWEGVDGGTDMIFDADGLRFPGWETEKENEADISHHYPEYVDDKWAQRDLLDFADDESGKMKYRSDIEDIEPPVYPGWVVQGGEELSITWELYISQSAGNETTMPAVKLANGTYLVRLDFEAVMGQYCAGVTGWVESAGTKITGGGKLNPIGNNERYLPMSMCKWHTIRVDLQPNGDFDAWIDGGGSDWKHVSGTAASDEDKYAQFGSTDTRYGLREWSTSCVAWGEGDELSGLPVLPGAPGGPDEEICDNNNVDDDGDLAADCDDSDCDCSFIVPENGDDNTCNNGIDDDADGDIDCADTDCAAIAHCGDDQPQYVLTMIRQVGDDNNSGWENTGVYFTVYDEDGNLLNGVTITDPLNYGCDPEREKPFSVTTGPGTPDCPSNPDPPRNKCYQDGHARYIPDFGGDLYPQRPYFGDTSMYWYVSAEWDPGIEENVVVNSEVTPVMYGWLPRPNGGPEGHYSWQVEFMRKSLKTNAGTFDPLNKVYIHDIVQMNTPAFDPEGTPIPNDWLDKDTVGVALAGFGFGTTMFGQTFLVPAGIDRIVSVRVGIAVDDYQSAQYELSIHPIVGDNPPDDETDIGPAIGAPKRSEAQMESNDWWYQTVVWPTREPDPDPDPENDVAVEVTPGQEYFLKVTRPGGNNMFTPYRTVDARVTSDGETSTGIEFLYPNPTPEDCPGAPHPDPMFTGDFYKYAPGARGVCYRLDGSSLIGDDVGCYHQFEESPPFILYTSQFYDMKGYIVGGSYGPIDPCSVHDPVFDTDDSGEVDSDDYNAFQDCTTIPGAPLAVFEALSQECQCMDRNGDQAIDQQDFGAFQVCYSGAGDADPTCDD